MGAAKSSGARRVWPARLSSNEDHFVNNQWGSLLRITNQKCTRNVKRTTKTSDMALLLVESFAICHPRCVSSGLRVSVDSPLSTSHPWHLELTLNCIHDYHSSFYSRLITETPRKLVLTSQLHCADVAALSIVNDVTL